MLQAYRLLRPHADAPAGATVYSWDDSDVPRATLNPLGGGPFFAVPAADLAEVVTAAPTVTVRLPAAAWAAARAALKRAADRAHARAARQASDERRPPAELLADPALRDRFEWDDARAATLYRLGQARALAGGEPGSPLTSRRQEAALRAAVAAIDAALR